jgi:hypothetical protein
VASSSRGRTQEECSGLLKCAHVSQEKFRAETAGESRSSPDRVYNISGMEDVSGECRICGQATTHRPSHAVEDTFDFWDIGTTQRRWVFIP